MTETPEAAAPRWSYDPQAVALLVLRLMIGAIFIGHGAQKLFGIWGGPGIEGFAKMLGAHIGFPAPTFFAYLAAVAEFGGGLALVLGLLARLGAAGIAVTMLVAILHVHLANGLLGGGPGKPGFDFPLACLAGVIPVLLLGAGCYSLDAAIAHTRARPG